MSNSYFELVSNKIQFRKLSADDIPLWEPFFLENPLLAFIGVDLKKSPRTLSLEWVKRQQERYTNSGLGHLALVEKESQEFMGVAGLLPREINGENCLEVAFSLLPQFRNKGLATEAAETLINFYKSQNWNEKLISIIHVNNLSSQNVVKKLGFQPGEETTYSKMPVYIFS